MSQFNKFLFTFVKYCHCLISDHQFVSVYDLTRNSILLKKERSRRSSILQNLFSFSMRYLIPISFLLTFFTFFFYLFRFLLIHYDHYYVFKNIRCLKWLSTSFSFLIPKLRIFKIACCPFHSHNSNSIPKRPVPCICFLFKFTSNCWWVQCHLWFFSLSQSLIFNPCLLLYFPFPLDGSSSSSFLPISLQVISWMVSMVSSFSYCYTFTVLYYACGGVLRTVIPQMVNSYEWTLWSKPSKRNP